MHRTPNFLIHSFISAWHFATSEAALVPPNGPICLPRFADFAVRTGCIRPEMVDERTLEIEAGRHPVLDALIGSEFVPNDTHLGTGETAWTMALITGPNMAGKSTYIRQTALVVLLAQAGSFVPATRARIGVVDRRTGGVAPRV